MNAGVIVKHGPDGAYYKVREVVGKYTGPDIMARDGSLIRNGAELDIEWPEMYATAEGAYAAIREAKRAESLKGGAA